MRSRRRRTEGVPKAWIIAPGAVLSQRGRLVDFAMPFWKLPRCNPIVASLKIVIECKLKRETQDKGDATTSGNSDIVKGRIKVTRWRTDW